MKNQVIYLFFLCCLTACNLPSSNKKAESIVADIKKEFAPDKRVAIFDIELVNRLEGIRVIGATNQLEAKEQLFEQLEKAGYKIIDSLEILPKKELGTKTYGVVNVSACNIRSKKGHSQELATQSILGTSLRVYEQVDSWFKVQTPDGYLGWLDEGGFTWMDEYAYQDWLSAPKVIYLADFGFSYQEPSLEAAPVSDLTSGNILKSVGVENDFIKVEYPDGRIGYVPEQQVVDYQTWLATTTPTAEKIVATAKTFLGRPYLWGGTSGKGVDCSGYTKMVFYLNGVQLARDASQQVHTGVEIRTDTTFKNLKAGDLLFFGSPATATKKERIRHVSIYLGNGEMIHSSGDAGVKIESLYRNAPNFAEERFNTFIRAKRMLISLGRNGVDLLKDLPQYNVALL